MRLKQQSFVDKYIEKVILGVAVLIGIGIIYFYVIGTPYAVEMTAGKRSTPDDVETTYKTNWQQLERAIKPPPKDETDTKKYLPDQLQKLVVPKYKERFDDRFAQKLVHSPNFYEIVFGEPGLAGIGGGGSTPDFPPRPLLVIEPPAAKDIATSSSYYVLDSDEVIAGLYSETVKNQDEFASDDEIKQRAAEWTDKAVSMAGKKNPRDFWGVSIAGTIAPQEWVDLYAAVESDKAMPASWYKDVAQFVLSIEVYRQTRDEKTGKFPADNEPGERVELLPGDAANIIANYVRAVQEAKTAKVEETEAAELQQELVAKLNLYADRLTKPVFLPTKSHRPWQQPDEMVAQLSPEDQQAIFRLNQQINRYESELTVLRDRVNSAANNSRLPITTPEIPGKTPRPGKIATPPKTPPVNPKVVPVKPPVDPNAPKKDPSSERIAFYETKLTELYKQKDAILAKLHKEDDPTKDPSKGGERIVVPPRGAEIPPRFDPRGLEGPPRGALQPPRRPGDPRDPRFPQVADGKIAPVKFWAHDVQVLPGQTYRYRVVYKVINPLFNKDEQLLDAQKKLGNQLEQTSLPSKWSDPVTIEPEVQYFVEDVKPETASVKWGIYRIYNGYRLHKQYDTRPGDPIGRTEDVEVRDDAGEKSAKKERVNLSVSAVMVDLKSPPKSAGAINVKGPMSVLIADMTDGKVAVRDPAADKTDPERVRLFNEASGALAGPKVPVGADGRPVPAGTEYRPPIDRPPEGGAVRPLVPPAPIPR